MKTSKSINEIRCPSYQDIPHDVVNAAIKVSTWFMQQGIEEWELMGIRSRYQKTPPERESGLDEGEV